MRCVDLVGRQVRLRYDLELRDGTRFRRESIARIVGTWRGLFTLEFEHGPRKGKLARHVRQFFFELAPDPHGKLVVCDKHPFVHFWWTARAFPHVYDPEILCCALCGAVQSFETAKIRPCRGAVRVAPR